jgi:hypothetical protein
LSFLAVDIPCEPLWDPICLQVYKVLSTYLQAQFPGLPAVVFQVAPFPVVIFTLLLLNVDETGWFRTLLFAIPP